METPDLAFGGWDFPYPGRTSGLLSWTMRRPLPLRSHSRCRAWPSSHRLSRSRCLLPGSLHPPARLRPPLLAAESSWARLDFGMWRCLVVASSRSDETRSQALDGEAEIRGLALSADGLSRVRAETATKCPTCASVNIKDFLSCIHTKTFLNHAGDAGFGS